MANLHPRGFYSHSAAGPHERLWKCPRCEFRVRATERPQPCDDHPLDDMTEEEN